jgi:hypothetical protein
MSEPGTVGAGAFDSEHGDRPERGQERQRRLVSGCGGRELGVAQVLAEPVDGGDVDRVGVGVGAADQVGQCSGGRCHPGAPSDVVRGVDAAGRASRQDIDEAWPGSY